MTAPDFLPRHEALLRLIVAAGGPVQPGTLAQSLHDSRPTINRGLRDLLALGLLEKLGGGRSTRYVATPAATAALDRVSSPSSTSSVEPGRLHWSATARSLVDALGAPLGTRAPIGYERAFVDDYIRSNTTALATTSHEG